jgi:hypothetical protein
MRRLACLLAALALPASAELTGRLFHTAQERAALDGARVRNVVEAPLAPVSADAPQSYQGYVKRSDGFTQHWVNDNASARPVAGLKPGQRRVDGQVLEAYAPPAE